MNTQVPGLQPLFSLSKLKPPSRGRLARTVTHVTFAVFLFATLATPSWRVGPFTWLPVVRFPMLGGRPADLGLLSLLPGLVVAGWLVARVRERATRTFHWGKLGVNLPLMGLTVLILAGLDAALTWRTAVQVVGLGLFWLTYLFVLNERPRLTVPLALVVLVQGTVAVGQFVCQRDLGLAFLGEMVLDPEVSGISVLWARDRRWLRGYGLTAHPNTLGAMLAILLLLLLPALWRAGGRRRAAHKTLPGQGLEPEGTREMVPWGAVALTVVASVGLVGLLVSFSRASWLAFGVGACTWVVRAGWDRLRAARRQQEVAARPRALVVRPPVQFVIPLLFAVLFLFAYRDLVISRFVGLDTPIEARSLNDRRRDAELALGLASSHPWRGVGAGNYLPAVREVNLDSRPVHSVPLLVAAELGVPGAVLWMWVVVAWLWVGGRAAMESRPATLAMWLAMVVVGLFDVSLWMTVSWRAAMLFAMLAAHVSRPE